MLDYITNFIIFLKYREQILEFINKCFEMTRAYLMFGKEID